MLQGSLRLVVMTRRMFSISDLKSLVYRYIRPDVHILFHPAHTLHFEKAFTHRTLDETSSYERLEFLGDSVASCVLTSYIFRRYANEDEAFLTRLRSKLISGKVYADVSKQIGLTTWLRVAPGDDHLTIKPSVQEDVFESFVGAMFLTYGFPLTEMWIVSAFEEHTDMATIVRQTLNPKERLMNYCLAMHGAKPEVEVSELADGRFSARVKHPETLVVVSEAHADVAQRAVGSACDAAANVLIGKGGGTDRHRETPAHFGR